MKEFRNVLPSELRENAIDLIGHQWMLITAGTRSSFNVMTASWGGVGMLWNKPVAFIFIRPQRFTFEFAERSPVFTCCFFDQGFRQMLQFCGSHSGRDTDKVRETGLTPLETENGGVFFAESRLVFECSKLYYQDIQPEGFVNPAIIKNYPLNDYHRMYIGEITNCLVKDK